MDTFESIADVGIGELANLVGRDDIDNAYTVLLHVDSLALPMKSGLDINLLKFIRFRHHQVLLFGDTRHNRDLCCELPVPDIVNFYSISALGNAGKEIEAVNIRNGARGEFRYVNHGTRQHLIVRIDHTAVDIAV